MNKIDEDMALKLFNDFNTTGIENIDFNNYTYKHLAAIKWKYGVEEFIRIKTLVCNRNTSNLKKFEKINITFLIPIASTWSASRLYSMLNENDRFEVTVTVIPFFNGTPKTIEDEYYLTLNYFEKKNYNVISSYDFKNKKCLSWGEIGAPDIVIHMNPHYHGFPEELKIYSFPLNTLHVYIPYGFMIYNGTSYQFNQMSHLLYWKIFCESELHKKMAQKYSDIGDSNVVNSGYIKMDRFYTESQCYDTDFRKIANRQTNDDVVKIIYAPHHSIGNDLCAFSTFQYNYDYMYEFAKKHSEISWVFKPHPLLKQATLKNDVFKSEEEYDLYVEKWRNLDNATIANEGEYIDLFKSSDAMILDSVSFLAEYLYTGKPYLLLTRSGQNFNDFGKELYKIIYKVDGENLEGISNFIKEVVIEKNDYKLKERQIFFDKYLNYKNYNKYLASEYIYNYLVKTITY